MGEFRQYPDSDPLRFGTGFLAEPGVTEMFSDETRINLARADSRERRAAEAEAAALQERYESKQWKIDHEGLGRTHEAILNGASAAMDRGDRKAARLERQAYDAEVEEIPEHLDVSRWALERAKREREAKEAVTPASLSDLKAVKGEISQLKAKQWASKRDARKAKGDLGTVKHVLGRILGK